MGNVDRKLPKAGIPRHVAIIMDGNGRWALRHGLPRAAGHREGARAVRRTIEAAIECGIEWMTLFAFSSENWQRPKDEVADLTFLLRQALLTAGANDQIRIWHASRRKKSGKCSLIELC